MLWPQALALRAWGVGDPGAGDRALDETVGVSRGTNGNRVDHADLERHVVGADATPVHAGRAGHGDVGSGDDIAAADPEADLLVDVVPDVDLGDDDERVGRLDRDRLPAEAV